jgi:hypothetical protein
MKTRRTLLLAILLLLPTLASAQIFPRQAVAPRTRILSVLGSSILNDCAAPEFLGCGNSEA